MPSAFSGGFGSTTDLAVTQTAHGFVAGDVVYYTGSVYAKAQADTVVHAEAIGMVIAATTDTFTLRTVGAVTGLSGLTAGSVYFLSPTVAGTLTLTEPVATGQISKPILVATSTTAGLLVSSRGFVLSPDLNVSALVAAVATEAATARAAEAAIKGDANLGIAYTMLPYEASTTSGTGAANRGYWMRALGKATGITKIRIHVAVSSGNICVAVYDNDLGLGKLNKPLNRKSTSGSVASPGTGVQELTLLTTIDVLPGDWMYVGADNTTVTFARGSAIVADTSGFCWFASTAFPAAAVAPGMSAASTGFYAVTA